jgi:hypothetical protein
LSVHELKTWPDLFDDVFCGVKCFDVRPDDRGFRVGDELVLHEWDPNVVSVDLETQVERFGRYTGRVCHRRVGYVLHGGRHGIADGYVVLGLVPSR